MDPRKHALGFVNRMHRSMCLDVVADAGATLTCSWTLGNIWMTWLFIVILEIGIPGRTKVCFCEGACGSRELCVISTRISAVGCNKVCGWVHAVVMQILGTHWLEKDNAQSNKNGSTH